MNTVRGADVCLAAMVLTVAGIAFNTHPVAEIVLYVWVTILAVLMLIGYVLSWKKY